ncbi:MAG: TonB family protein [Candidatus Aminicenantes bacterium]|nr:TonB family protein [Candidatus Aminicenantes bacterium]
MAKKKILLIDFDSEFIKFLSRSLTDEGYEVITASDGAAGFEKFSEVHPDLVIMEAMLPKFHGFELCSRITSHPTKKSPVIIVTGIYKDAAYKTEALKSLGASAFFEKPINLDELLNKVYELIGKPETRKAASPAEEDLDKLLKEALSMTIPDRKPTEKVKPVEKTITEEAAQGGTKSKDDEVDLILKSKLKDIISETTKSEPKPVSAAAGRIEKEHPTSKPLEPKKAEPVTTAGTPGTEAIKKPSPPVEPVAQRKAESAKLESKSEPKIEARPEPKIEPKPASAQTEEKPSSVSVPVATPFKGFIEEKEEAEIKKKSSGKFIGIAAAALAIVAVVAILSMKKKDTTTFSGQPSNQVAALQTVDSGQPKAQPSEQDLNKEIENQMTAYRDQKAQSGNNSSGAINKNSRNSSPAGKTINKIESTPTAVAPIMPKETPQLAVNINHSQTAGQVNLAESGVTPISPEQGSSKEKSNQTPETKVEEQPVAIPVQKPKTGDLVPLSMVDVEPKVIKTVEPVYPEADRRMGIKGNVILNVLISETGEVLDVVVIRGIRGSVALEKEAINAVKKWKFLPAEKDGVKVRVWKPITIGFGLNK